MLALLCVVLASAGVTTVAFLRPDPPPGTPATPIALGDPLASLPVSFEPAGDGTFVSRGPGYSLVLRGSEAVVGVPGGAFGLRPAGPTADPAAPLVPGRPLGGTVTRLTGDDPSAWQAGLSTYGRVEARQVWPGVDMVWHGDRRALEHDMVVAPGVDPSVVAFDVDGARSLALAPGGDLLIELGERAAARLARPVVYQEVAGARRAVTGDFVLLGPAQIGFRVGPYDTTRPLVIDPTLVTSTLLGGIGNDAGYAIAVDAQGNTYVTGTTESPDFPTNASLQAALANSASGATSDVFVSKVSPDGNRLVWSTYLGGGGRDTGYAVAVGGDGSVYVAGVTESSDFPRVNPSQANYGGGSSDAFVAKLGPSGAALEWSTVVGGGAIDRGRGMALDSAGNAYLTGSTSSADFPAVTPLQPGPFRPDDSDAFLVKVPTGGGPLAFATRLGGSNDDHGLAVAVDAQGQAYVTGDTLSPAFPTVRPVQATSGGSAGGVAGSFADAFVSKFNPAGSALLYSTFLGGSDVDQGTSIAVDDTGAAYVAGNTKSSNFPTVVPLQAAKGDDVDAFVAKLDPPGGALVYATYVGGSGADGANGIDVGGDNSPVVTGTTGSANWPTTRPVQAARGGGDDAFVLKLTADGRGSAFSSFVGGRDADSGMGVALDARGRAHVLGLTGSQDFPSVAPLQGSRAPAGGDAFVATLDLADAAGPAPSPGAAAAGSQSSSSSIGHDRRVRALGGLTVALLLAAVAQTVYLRRRASTSSPSSAPSPSHSPARQSPARPSPARPAPKPAPKGSATPGLTVLDRGAEDATGPEGGPAKAGAGTGQKSTRTPKARGGPKTAGVQKAAAGKATSGGAGKGARTAAGALGGAGAAGAPPPDDGGPATMAAPSPPPPPRAKPQEPAIAHLLEEDLWAPEPREAEPAAAAVDAAGGPEDRPERPAAAATAAPAAAPARPDAAPEPPPAAAPPPVPEAPPAPDPVGIPAAPAIPPVPAEELSFWDLFPEDLPPARPATFPVEDLLADHIALPEGPESAAGRLVGAPPPEEPRADEEPPPPPRPPRPPEAEIVIAELLDGPPPTGLRPSAESPWAPQPPADDFLIDDLLLDSGDGGPDEEPGDEPPPPSARPTDQQARIAADRARRRRARRRGKGRPAGDG